MTKPKPKDQLKPRGRKTKYNPITHPAMVKALTESGAINTELAEKLKVSVPTLNAWSKKYPEFFSAKKEGKDKVDKEVEISLFKKAIGYEYVETKEIVSDKDGKRTETTVKFVPPDVTAQIFWLKNRQPHDWRDKRDVELTGKDGAPLNPKQMSDEDIIALIRKERETNKKK